jgi:hypothetical protein
MNRYHTFILVSPAILLVMLMISGSGGTLLYAGNYNISNDRQAYIFDKFQDHNHLIMLGSRHKRQPILELISGLVPNLRDAGVTHLGLEICSDQQAKIDNFLRTGDGLSGIDIHSQIDCPEYRNLFARLRKIPDSMRPVVKALDLPKSMYGDGVSRDEYMARPIAQIVRPEPESKMLAILGNNHILKKPNWQERLPNKHRSVRSYLADNVPNRAAH